MTIHIFNLGAWWKINRGQLKTWIFKQVHRSFSQYFFPLPLLESFMSKIWYLICIGLIEKPSEQTEDKSSLSATCDQLQYLHLLINSINKIK